MVEKAPAVRQELRPHVRDIGVRPVEDRGRHRFAARTRHAIKGAGTGGSESGGAGGPPRRATPERGVAQDPWGAAAPIHDLKLAVGEKSDRTAIGGPEREERRRRARDWRGFEGIEPADVEPGGVIF